MCFLLCGAGISPPCTPCDFSPHTQCECPRMPLRAPLDSAAGASEHKPSTPPPSSLHNWPLTRGTCCFPSFFSSFPVPHHFDRASLSYRPCAEDATRLRSFYHTGAPLLSTSLVMIRYCYLCSTLPPPPPLLLVRQCSAAVSAGPVRAYIAFRRADRASFAACET